MNAQTATDVLAIGLLVGMGALFALWVVSLFRRSPFTPAQTVIYGYNWIMVRVVWRTRVSGPLPISADQGAVVVCNHRAPIDPSFIAVTTLRVVHWMVAKEYCENPVLASIFRLCEVIPVGRGGIDMAATKAAIRYAREGGLVGLFPEGRINTTDRLLLPGRRGAALIALKAQVPVVPCYVSGSPYDGTIWGWIFMPAKARIEVGRPIDVSQFSGRENDRGVAEELTGVILREIARLAGQPDYQPELAGRTGPRGPLPQ